MPFYMAEGGTDTARQNDQNTLAVINRYGRNFWTLSSDGHGWNYWHR